MANPWIKFYTTDWRADPALRMCSLAARGLWIEMICIMHEAEPYGHLLVNGQTVTDAQLAALVGAPSDQIAALLGELESAGVFSRTRAGVIYSRKLSRMMKKAATARNNGRKGGNPSLSKERKNNPSDKGVDKGEDKPQKLEARSQIKIDDDDDAGERLSELVPDKPDKPDPPGWRRLDREALLTAMGADPVSGLVGPNGRQIGGLADMHTAGAWLDDLGLTEGEVMAIIAEVMAKKHDGPPSSFRYFSAAMATFAGQKGEPKLTPTTPSERKPRSYQSPGRKAETSWDEDPFIKRMKQKYNVGQPPQEAAE